MHRRRVRFLDEEPVSVLIREPKDHIQKKWLAGHYYECQRNGLLSYIAATHEKGLTYIDAGASIGNHTLFFARVMEAERVYAIEPVPESYQHLCDNLELNHDLGWRVAAYMGAIGAHKGSVDMLNVNPANVGMWRIVDEPHADDDPRWVTVAIEPLDDYVGKDVRVDVLKMDVEHYQIPALQGAARILRDWRPVVYVECEVDDAFQRVKTLLHDFGYKYDGVCLNHTPTYKFEAAF